MMMMMVYHCHGDDVNQKWMLGWFSLFSSNRSSLPCTTRPETSASSNLLVFHSAHVTRCHNVTMVAGLLSLAPQSVALSRLAFRDTHPCHPLPLGDTHPIHPIPLIASLCYIHLRFLKIVNSVVGYVSNNSLFANSGRHLPRHNRPWLP